MANHDEMVESSFFGKKFKNPLLDFYVLGYKSFVSSQSERNVNEDGRATPADATLSSDWSRLRNILPDTFEYSENERKIQYITCSSQELTENPFHRLYEFCRYNDEDVRYFFTQMLALSPKVSLAEGIKSLDLRKSDFLDNELRKKLNESRLKWSDSDFSPYEKGTSNNEDRDFISLKAVLKKELDTLRKELIMENDTLLTEEQKKEKNTLSLRHRELTDLVDQKVPQAQNRLKEQLDQLKIDLCAEQPALTSAQLNCLYPKRLTLFQTENTTVNDKMNQLYKLGFVKDFPEKRKEGGKDIHRWSLSDVYLSSILDRGIKVDEKFEYHFQEALDFFSRYAPLGTVGSLILNRCDSEQNSVFRFKHEYFVHAINDYHLYTLLSALENEKQWCLIRFTQPVTGKQGEILCYPLEIRVSSTMGSQNLGFYEPFSRSYACLPLEYIDQISLVEDGSVTAPNDRTLSVNTPEIKQDIGNARNALANSWGVQTIDEGGPSGNAKTKTAPHEVEVQIQFDPKTESYISKRVKKESRLGNVIKDTEQGKLTFHAEVTDPQKLIPWVRSFYCRVIGHSGLEVNSNMSLSIFSDLDKMSGIAPSEWAIPRGVIIPSKPAPQDALFNEVFSIYYRVISEVLMELFTGSNTSFTEDDVRFKIDQKFDRYKNQLGRQTKDLLTNELNDLLFKSNLFLQKTEDGVYKKCFTSNEKGFYSYILPLSQLEIRWLLAILDDKKIGAFLTPKEIGAIRNVLSASKLSPLPMEKINYFDRFHRDEQGKERETQVLREFLSAVRDRCLVSIKYGEYIVGDFLPIAVEYSKRDDIFRGYFQSMKNQAIFIFVFSRFKNIQDFWKTGNHFDENQAKAAATALEDYHKIQNLNIAVEFSDDGETPARILQEFSPWKKLCHYDRETGIYKLTISYFADAASELAIRLLAYGPSVRIIGMMTMIQFADIEKRKAGISKKFSKWTCEFTRKRIEGEKGREKTWTMAIYYPAEDQSEISNLLEECGDDIEILEEPMIRDEKKNVNIEYSNRLKKQREIEDQREEEKNAQLERV